MFMLDLDDQKYDVNALKCHKVENLCASMNLSLVDGYRFGEAFSTAVILNHDCY